MESGGFLDKAKAAMGQAAARAKEEVEDLQARHDLGNAEKELGRLAFELAEAGELEHDALDEHVERIRELRARIEDETDEGEAGEDAAESASGEE